VSRTIWFYSLGLCVAHDADVDGTRRRGHPLATKYGGIGMDTVSDIIGGTPTWVWVLLVFLIIRGVQATKTGVMPFWRLLIIPTLFTGWGLLGLLTTLQLTAFSVGTWVIAIVAGCLAGRHMARDVTLRADKPRGLVELPGSVFTLVLILVIFAAKYVLGYQLAVNPDNARSAIYVFFDAGISGLVAGLFIGRVWIYHRKYQAAEDTPLQEEPLARQ